MTISTEPGTKTISLLIVDDHQLVRDGIRVMLESQPHLGELEITEAEDGNHALEKIRKQKFDIILVDYQMPGMIGDELVRKILSLKPNTKILALSNYDELTYINNMMSSGAMGYVLKNIDPPQLITAIQTILNGKKYFSNDVAVKIIDGETSSARSKMSYEDFGISQRELDVLSLIAKENTNEEIAKKLEISKRTVDTHRQHLINKLRVKNTAGLVRAVYELGLLENYVKK